MAHRVGASGGIAHGAAIMAISKENKISRQCRNVSGNETSGVVKMKMKAASKIMVSAAANNGVSIMKMKVKIMKNGAENNNGAASALVFLCRKWRKWRCLIVYRVRAVKA
jgi:urease accessory protein UreH